VCRVAIAPRHTDNFALLAPTAAGRASAALLN
jgi:hypothetical protein